MDHGSSNGPVASSITAGKYLGARSGISRIQKTYRTESPTTVGIAFFHSHFMQRRTFARLKYGERGCFARDGLLDAATSRIWSIAVKGMPTIQCVVSNDQGPSAISQESIRTQ